MSDPSTSPSPPTTPNLYFRNVIPTDLPAIHALESKAYPSDLAASRSQLQYRQHHAATYFRCAVLFDEDVDEIIQNAQSLLTNEAGMGNGDTTTRAYNRHNSLDGKGEIVAFITATRCQIFPTEEERGHDPTGPILAIHSIVVSEQYRHRGVGSSLLKNYLLYLVKLELKHAIEKIVLVAKKDQLTFYVKEGGFRVMRQSKIKRNESNEVMFECERELIEGGTRRGERRSECWIVDSFTVMGKAGSGVGGWVGRTGTGNPAAVVMVPALLEEPSNGIGSSGTAGEGSGSAGIGDFLGNERSTAPEPAVRTTSCNSSLTSIPIPQDSFLQNPNHESTISWMKTIAQEFNLSETAFVWEHAPKPPAAVDCSSTGLSQHSPPQNSPPTQPQGLLSRHFERIRLPNEGTRSYTIRFVTRDGSAVDLCGHATMAASQVVFKKAFHERGVKYGDMSALFYAKNDVVLKSKPVVSKKGAGTNESLKITMDFPWKDVIRFEDGSGEKEAVMAMLQSAFYSMSAVENGDGGNKEEDYEIIDDDVMCIGVDDGGDDLFIELRHSAFHKLPRRLNDTTIRSMLELGCYNRGVIICCAVDDFSRRRQEEENLSHPSARVGSGEIGAGGGGGTVDFLSRFFGPKVGIEEDPVTGSAHCVLGPYFAEKLGRETVVGKQKSQRGGIVECTPIQKREIDPSTGEEVDGKKIVSISGTAVMVMNGMLHI